MSFYNTESAHPLCPFDLEKTKHIAVLGAGNVTLDIARIFLRNPTDTVVKENVTTFVHK